MRKSIFPLLLIAFIFGSCVEEVKPKPVVKKDEKKEEVKRKFASNTDHLNQPRLNQIDSIKYIVGEWNRALNESDFKTLQSLYADSISSYHGDVTPEEIIEIQGEIIDESPEYSQRASLRWVQLPTNKSATVICYLLKQAYREYGTSEPEEILIELKKTGDGYKITKELEYYDYALSLEYYVGLDLPIGLSTYEFNPTEISAPREGSEYGFSPTFARIEVNYNGNPLDENNVEVSFFSYEEEYGMEKENVIRNAQFIDGSLIFETSEYFVDEDVAPDDDEYYINRYIFLGDNLTLIESQDIEWETCRFLKVE